MIKIKNPNEKTAKEKVSKEKVSKAKVSKEKVAKEKVSKEQKAALKAEKKVAKAAKTPKTEKAPKAAKAPKMPKVPKAANAQKAAGKKGLGKPAKRTTGSAAKGAPAKPVKSSVPFLRSIKFRLIASFSVPVLCIIILGTVSYSKASDAIVNSYKTSSEQTVEMMQQYMTLTLSTVQEDLKSYYNNGDLKEFYSGVMADKTYYDTLKEWQATFQKKPTSDSKFSQVMIISDDFDSIYSGSQQLSATPYTDYINTAQGATVAGNKNGWHVFGIDTEADTVLGIKENTYSIRIARHMPSVKAILIADVSLNFVRSAMASVDPGEGGYVALITTDGAEFYSDPEVVLEEPMFYGQEHYNITMASGENSGTSEITINGKDYLYIYSRLSIGSVCAVTLIPSEIILAQTKGIQQISVGFTVVAAIIAIGLGLLMSRQMSGTITYILGQLNKVANGDLTVHLVSKSKDEFGQLCKGVNSTVEHMKGLITNVNEVSVQVNDAAAYVTEASETFMHTANDIQRAISEIEVGVNKLDSGSEDCLNQMDSLSGKISNVSENANEIGKLTSSTGETINCGITSVQGLTDSAESTTKITQSVIIAIEELESKSKSINTIIAAINDIAEQTNLLSLNASIEAARAGEAGRGFAVVAEEIRKLSDQCLASAAQIGKIVSEIVGKTGEVVKIAREAEDVVSSQAGAVEETTQSFRDIDEQVASLLKALDTISANVSEMSSARTETLDAIESISAVSAETAACSSSVYTTAGTQLEAISELDNAATQLREKADKLVEMLGNFTI